MISLSKLTRIFLIILLFSPLLAYFTLNAYFQSLSLYTGLLAIGIGIMYFINSLVRLKKPSYSRWLLLFIIYSLLFQTISEKALTFAIFKKVILTNPNVYTYFLIIAISNTKFSDKFIKNIIPIINFTVILAALASIYQIFNNKFLDSSSVWYQNQSNVESLMTGDLYQDRRSSIFGYIDMNELGLSFIPLLSVLIGFYLFQRNKSYIPFLVLGGITAFLSNTRYVMIGFFIITLQVLFYERIRLLASVKYIIISVIMFFMFYQVLLYLGYNIDYWIESRLFAEGSIEETTRFKAIENFILFFPSYYLFGSGGMTDAIRAASAAVGSSQIHVGYLAGLVYYGVIGSFFIFGFWFLLARQLYRTAKLTNYWGSFFAFIVFLASNVTLVTFHIYFYGIVFALVFDKYYSDKHVLTKSNSINSKNE